MGMDDCNDAICPHDTSDTRLKHVGNGNGCRLAQNAPFSETRRNTNTVGGKRSIIRNAAYLDW
jgi:hypothetical protein